MTTLYVPCTRLKMGAQKSRKKKRKGHQIQHSQITLINLYLQLVHSILWSAIPCATSFRQMDGRKTLMKFCPLTTSAREKSPIFKLWNPSILLEKQ